MSTTDSTSPRSALRDFINRREPGARWMLVLLVLLAILLAALEFTMPGPGFAGGALILTLLALNRDAGWSLPVAPAFPDPCWTVPPSSRRWIWLMAAAAAILALWPRSSGLNRGLDSEEINRLPAGIISPPTAKSQFSLQNWRKSLPDFKPGVHGAWSELEISTGWKLTGGKKDGPPSANERALRIFPWISGLLTVGLVTLLAAAMGSPRAGLAAGLIMAVHPLHIRWSLEVGGLSTLLMSFTAAMLCMLQVFRTNLWRWWAGLAAAQTVCMLCHGSAAFGLAALNGAAIVVFIKSGASRRAVGSHIRRLFLASILTVLPVLSVILTKSQWPWGTGNGFWPSLLSGMSGTTSGPGLDSLIQEPAWRSWMVWGILPLCSLAGLIALLIQDWRTWFVGGSLAGASLLAGLLAGPEEALPFALLLFPLTLAWSGTWLMRLFPAVPRMAHAPLVAAVMFVLVTAPALQRIIAAPRSPLHEVANIVRNHPQQHPTTTTATFGYELPAARISDPGVVFIDRLATLRKLVDVAFEEDRPLFVYHSQAPHTLSDWPYTLKELQTSGRFHLIQEFSAFDPRQNIRLYKYQPREQIIRLNVKPEKK